MREESAKESAERRLRAGLRQGRAYVDAFSHTISRRFLLFGLATLNDVNQYVQRYPLPCSLLPQPLTLNPACCWCTLSSRHRYICPRLLTLITVLATNPTRSSPESTQSCAHSVTQVTRYQHLPLSDISRRCYAATAPSAEPRARILQALSRQSRTCTRRGPCMTLISC
jgi:hypothetical protein